MSRHKTMSKRRAKRLLESGYWVSDEAIAEHGLMQWMAGRGYRIVHDPVRSARGIQRTVVITGDGGDGAPIREEFKLGPKPRDGHFTWHYVRRIAAA